LGLRLGRNGKARDRDGDGDDSQPVDAREVSGCLKIVSKSLTRPVSRGNLIGDNAEGQGNIAAFPLEEFRGLPGGAVEVVIVTKRGERRCVLPVKNRARFRDLP